MTGKVTGIARRHTARVPMETLNAVKITPESGLEGDFRGAAHQRAVTVLFAEDWAAAIADLGRVLPWVTRRANILVECFDERAAVKHVGAQFSLGPVLLEVWEETAPCSVMEKQAEGLRAALKPAWRGGVSCRVLKGGPVALGDPVALLAPNEHIVRPAAASL